MNKIKVLIDSCSSLTKKQADELGVTIVPTTFILDGVECNPIDTDITLDQYYQDILTKKVGTACVNSFIFEETFREILEQGEDVIYIALSSGLSSTYNNAINGASELKDEFGDRVLVLDPLTGGAGMHFVLHETIRMVNEGKSLAEIKEALDKNKLNVRSYFTIGLLDHLQKGGRLSKVEAAIGNALKAKPIVSANDEGKLKIKAIHLGKRRTIKEMADSANRRLDDTKKVYISYTNNEAEANFLKDKLLEGNPNLQIEFSRIDYTLGAHCGPETVALFFIKKIRK